MPGVSPAPAPPAPLRCHRQHLWGDLGMDPAPASSPPCQHQIGAFAHRPDRSPRRMRGSRYSAEGPMEDLGASPSREGARYRGAPLEAVGPPKVSLASRCPFVPITLCPPTPRKAAFWGQHRTFGQVPSCPSGSKPSQGMLPGGGGFVRGQVEAGSVQPSTADKSFSHRRKLRRGTKELNLFKTQPGVQTSLSYCNS